MVRSVVAPCIVAATKATAVATNNTLIAVLMAVLLATSRARTHYSLPKRLPAILNPRGKRPVTDTVGYPEILWMVRDLFRRARSNRWKRRSGTVEGYEFRAAKNNGWLVVYYSYDYKGQ